MLVWVFLVVNREDCEDVEIKVFGGVNGEERAKAELAKAPSQWDEAEYYYELDSVRIQ